MNKRNKCVISEIELLYICDDDFITEVNKVRKKFNIKVENDGLVDTVQFINFDNKLIISKSFAKNFENEIINLSRKFGLEDSFFEVQMLVESGIAYTSFDDKVSIKRNITYKGKITRVKVREARDKNGKILPDAGLEMSFSIRKPITDKHLSQWFEDNNGQILVAMNDFFRGYAVPIVKNKKLPRILRVIELREKQKIPFSKIADVLCNEYEDDFDVIDGKVNEQSVKQIYHRYTNRHKKVTKKK